MAKEQTQQSGSEVVPWEEGAELEGIAAIEPTAELVSQAYAAIQDGQLPPEIGDPAIVARLIQERIKKGTFEESLTPTEKLPAWKDVLLDVPVAVYGFHMNRSTITPAEGAYSPGVYAVVELAVPETGEIQTVQTGGANVLMQLVKAWEERRFPFVAVLVAQPTGTPGRSTLWLRSVDKSG